MCLPCLGGAAEDVVETPDPVSSVFQRFNLLKWTRHQSHEHAKMSIFFSEAKGELRPVEHNYSLPFT